ncbi:hypothetical protein [Wolbachia endosymbiont (group A) of Sphecodes monilicornis]|uniref:hypothetical protein n=1 Tax=Wolbachia endosymbiont (group A) of Sphecodes monilicornis TaxID=2954060 RepID=UPI0022322764|nr:hypothetical protein [Wolbachia endosymbiont (group A) of Sphecodes monilicornis]
MWHIFSSTVKWLFIMNFVSNCQFFSLERCNKAIPVSRTGMTSSFFWDSSVTRWNDSSPTSYRDSFAVSQPLTRDPANK